METSSEKVGCWQERYALSTSIFQDNSLEEALPKIAAAGFKYVEITANGTHLDPRGRPDTLAVRSLMGDLGLQAHSIHTPYTNLKIGHPDIDLSESHPEVVAASLEIGAQVGAKMAVVHVTAAPKGLSDDVYERSREVSIAFVGKLRLRARELGITLALENLGLRPHLRRRFGSSLKELSEAFPGPDIGFCLDVGHALRNGLDIRSQIEAAGSRLICLHIHSNDGVDDCHWLPTQGLLDWAATSAELHRSGYGGRYVLEIRGGSEPVALLDQTAAFAQTDAQLDHQ